MNAPKGSLGRLEMLTVYCRCCQSTDVIQTSSFFVTCVMHADIFSCYQRKKSKMDQQLALSRILLEQGAPAIESFRGK